MMITNDNYWYRESDRVVMTQEGLDHGICTGNNLYPPSTKGTVTRDQFRDNHITVRRDGRKGYSSYHASFWVLER